MGIDNWAPSAPVHRLSLDWLEAAGVEVQVLRLDLLDPLISGNKWFKLRPHLLAARQAGALGLISLGGAHSNHLHALAAAGRRFGLQTVGLLRGNEQDTPTVSDLHALGMHLHWLGYGAYRQRHETHFWTPWLQRYPGFLPINEGGAGLPAAQGCAAMVEMVRTALGGLDYQGWWLAAGTGTTLAGLVLAEQGSGRLVHGAMAVPAGHGIERNLHTLLDGDGANYRLVDASRGGFARLDAELACFILDTESQCGLPLEPVYTGKALLALREQVRAGFVARGTRLVFLHSGGLQGRRAMDARMRELAAQ
ncbi:1-aminocyclopropane-1-carboxylate deaminase/D-cysteine desulfhydrase [Pseudomonas sp. LRF_L74]|uniref:1-aminocyclopropane-1-carboxylate deaminase/D-cysteine desulfhydrase n=1 Tax=Pseudomonas sp. LRF_L74 TaxID=3369422 RepID=UPI003F5E50ED